MRSQTNIFRYEDVMKDAVLFTYIYDSHVYEIDDDLLIYSIYGTFCIQNCMRTYLSQLKFEFYSFLNI